MKIMKKLFVSILFAGMVIVSTETFANEVGTKQPIHVAKETSATAKKENYVRITQPSQKETIQTFDSQINIMGEASVGTKITIIVYYGEEVDKLTEDMPKVIYELKPVGATGTFSQLIDLKEGPNKKEGQNNIIIRYSYDQSNISGELYIKVIRKPEAEKELIKSYIAPQTILDKIVTPSEEGKAKTTPTQGTPLVSK